MANLEQVDLLKRNVTQWNEWRVQHPEIRPDLSDAKLLDANLGYANLSRADLRNANLLFTNLSEADLHGADLRNARLGSANLSYASLYKTDLGGADLNGARLIFTNLRDAKLLDADLGNADLGRAHLDGADLSGAHLAFTIVAQVDLRFTKGLAELDHRGPSRVELHTVWLPQDSSALHFLRGAGVPDEWIDFWRSMMTHPIQYHSLFISYSSKDETLAKRLYADLQAHGVRCWFAPEDLKIGDKFRSRIDEAIHLQEKLLLLLSEHAIESDWVEVEVEASYEKEAREKRPVLFPIRLDGSVMQTTQAWAANLRRTRHIGDFTHWTDPPTYQQAFERLLRDLKKA